MARGASAKIIALLKSKGEGCYYHASEIARELGITPQSFSACIPTLLRNGANCDDNGNWFMNKQDNPSTPPKVEENKQDNPSTPPKVEEKSPDDEEDVFMPHILDMLARDLKAHKPKLSKTTGGQWITSWKKRAKEQLTIHLKEEHPQSELGALRYLVVALEVMTNQEFLQACFDRINLCAEALNEFRVKYPKNTLNEFLEAAAAQAS